MLLFSFSSIFAAVTVTYKPQAACFPYNSTGNVITAEVVTTEAIAAFDLITKVTAAGSFGVITGVNVSSVAGAVVDLSKVDGVCQAGNGPSGDPDYTRIYGFDCGTPVIMPVGTYNFTFTVSTCCDTGNFVMEDGGNWLVDPDPVNATTMFVNTSAAAASLTVVPRIYRVCNTAPTITNCPSAALVFSACDLVTYNFTATDPDNSCKPAPDLSWSVVSGPGSIDNQGHFQWDPPPVGGICGLHTTVVKATDEYGGFATCSFDISLTNQAPSFTQCPTPGSETNIYWGWTADGDVTAVDPDNCPVPLVYSLNSFSGPTTAGPFAVDPLTGVWSWPTTFGDDAYLGTFTVVIDVTDSCATAQCTFTIHVMPTFQVKIEKTHGSYQGMYEFVDIELKHWTEGFGGYDFLIRYDNSGLSLLEALPGNILTNCGFEYFQYRFGNNGNCHGSCPSGLVRIVAIADANNGANHPSCYGQNHPNPPATDPIRVLATLKFLVTNDRTFECMFMPIGFYWFDCGDNTISSITGDTLHLDRHVYGFDQVGEITGEPGYGGWQGIDPPVNCMIGQKYYPDTVIDFCDGGIDIVCKDSIDARGDFNLNGISNEIADAVLFTNYFLYGVAVLDPNPTFRQAQIAASDINADGTPLTVGDLVYLLRVIVGDALPYPKMAPFSSYADVSIANGTLSTSSNEEIGGIFMTFKADNNYTVVSHTNMTVLSAKADDGLLHVLVYSGMENMKNRIPSGNNELVTVTGGELNSIQIADYYGNLMASRVEKTALPTEFALLQNAPNPFNPTTKIGFNLPVVSDWKLDIYNVSGQLVQSYNGTNIGHVEVNWNASNAASGIYFYKLNAGSFSETKKMVLMK